MYDDLIKKWIQPGEATDLTDLQRDIAAREIDHLGSPYRLDGNLAAWYLHGLEELLGWYGVWSYRRYATMQELREAIAKTRAEVEKERRENPDYKGWHKNEEVLLDTWMALTPFQIWKMRAKYHEEMKYLLEDHLHDILFGTAEITEKDARRIWEKIIIEWEEAQNLG